MNNIRKKNSKEISYFRYFFCNQWNTNRPIYLFLTVVNLWCFNIHLEDTRPAFLTSNILDVW